MEDGGELVGVQSILSCHSYQGGVINTSMFLLCHALSRNCLPSTILEADSLYLYMMGFWCKLTTIRSYCSVAYFTLWWAGDLSLNTEINIYLFILFFCSSCLLHNNVMKLASAGCYICRWMYIGLCTPITRQSLPPPLPCHNLPPLSLTTHNQHSNFWLISLHECY